MSFIRKIPFRARPAYFWYARSMILDGIFFGGAFEILNFVARKTIGISGFQLSFTQFFLYIGMFAGFFIPHIFQVRRKMPYIFWTSFPAKALFIVLAFISDPNWFFWISAVALFLAQMYIPMYAAVLKSSFPDSHRGTIVGHARSITLIGQIAASAIAGYLLDMGKGFLGLIFPAAALCGILSTVCFTRIRERTPQRTQENDALVTLSQLWHIMKNDRHFMRYQSAFALSGFANLAGLPLYVLYVVDVLKADYFQIAITVGIINNIVGALTLAWWGRLTDRHPNPMLIRTFLSLLWMLHPLCYAFASDMTLVYLGAVLYGFLQAGGYINWLLGSLYFCNEENTPVYTMLHACNNGLRGAIAPLVGYLLYRCFGFFITFFLLAGMMLLASILMFQLFLETRKLPRFNSHGQ